MSRLSSISTWFKIIGIYLEAAWRYWRWRLKLWRNPSAIMESTQRSMKYTLLFIRHGQTVWNAEHRLPGQLPGVELNDKGREQAKLLGDALAILPITAVISSPLERARDTAEYVAAPHGLTLQFDDDLMDIDVGPWAGQNYEDLSKNNEAWKTFTRNPSTAPEGVHVETFPQVQQRALAAVERWMKRESTGNYPAFVAHADVVKLLVAHYTGLDAWRAGSLYIDNASVSIVEIDSEALRSARVIAIGWNPRPGWLRPPVPPTTPSPDAGAQGEKSSEEQKGEQVGEQQS